VPLALSLLGMTLGTPFRLLALLDQLIVYGTPSEARRRLGRWHEAGASFPILLLRPDLTAGERALVLETFRPMLRSA
jgi:alkanesulfonate monooxygenase SsuD/methylene tetrahydromethanopterin reductase-like flavin-dependent oxidoreductase (luciferase family)